MFKPRLILHPTDYSDRSRFAFQIAVDLAEQYQSLILVLHVVKSLGPENVTFAEAETQLQPEAYRERLWKELRQLHPAAGEKVAMDYLLVEGVPAREILRIAAERHCDLIVLGTHGRSGVDRVMMGSVAEKVLRKSACPVLVTRSPANPT